MKKDIWADHIFIQSSAWYLHKDIVIHQNISSNPIQIISGNIEDENVPCKDPDIHVGYLFRRHYQSILPRTQNMYAVKATKPEKAAESLSSERNAKRRKVSEGEFEADDVSTSFIDSSIFYFCSISLGLVG